MLCQCLSWSSNAADTHMPALCWLQWLQQSAHNACTFRLCNTTIVFDEDHLACQHRRAHVHLIGRVARRADSTVPSRRPLRLLCFKTPPAASCPKSRHHETAPAACQTAGRGQLLQPAAQLLQVWTPALASATYCRHAHNARHATKTVAIVVVRKTGRLRIKLSEHACSGVRSLQRPAAGPRCRSGLRGPHQRNPRRRRSRPAAQRRRQRA